MVRAQICQYSPSSILYCVEKLVKQNGHLFFMKPNKKNRVEPTLQYRPYAHRFANFSLCQFSQSEVRIDKALERN
jgi:2-polyprenyl-3-methyl-5-hydroxy-6-metoxy-1,4-benzoquinol methylase